MAIEIKKKRDTSAGTFFTVSIDGTDIADCKIMNGTKGEWVAGPGKPPKEQGGKWINLVYFSDAHQKEIIEKVKTAASAIPWPANAEREEKSFNPDDDIPF